MTVVSIDFGTSNTVVSILNPDTKQPETLRFGEISHLFKVRKASGEIGETPVVPTLAFVKADNNMVFGEQVRSLRLGLAQPDRLFKDFKRDLVADFQPPPRQLDGKSYSVEFVSELFVSEIWRRLPEQSIQPSRAIFTVPVGAFERYLDWFRDLAQKLEVPEVRVIDESTAAALGYAVERPGAVVLVVDFGGGTLDLSLVRTGNAQAIPDATTKLQTPIQAEVLAKSDAYVGGVDIDVWILEDYLQQIGSSRREVGEIGWQNLLEVAERLKIKLSRSTEAKESWFDDENFIALDLELSRERLDNILEERQLLEQLRQALDEVLAIALGKGIAKPDIEMVVMVGGSCLIPAVQQLIISYFGRSRVRLDKAFEAVSHGALALSSLAGVDDYLRHTYAIRLWDPHAKAYSYLPLFEKGIKYPCDRSEPMTLQAAIEGQREIRLDIGEVAQISQAEVTFDEQGRMSSGRLLEREQYRSVQTYREQVCVAHLDPPGQLGIDRILVKFEVDERRMLLATVRDLLTEQVLVNRGAIAKLE